MQRGKKLSQVKRYRKQIILTWWCALITVTVVSLQPNMGPPTTPLLGIGMDKFIHLGTYLLLVAVPAVIFNSGRLIVLSVLLVATMSIGIEFAQNLVPGRLFSMGDVIANMTGVFLGTATGLYFRRFGLEYFR